MQPVHYHYKKQSVKHIEKTHTAQFKYVVKSVPLSVITVSREVMQNMLFYVDIGTWVKYAYIKGK